MVGELELLIYEMKHVRILTRGGTRKRLSEVEPGEEIIGIILRKSKKVVSLNFYLSTSFSSIPNPSCIKDMWIGELGEAEKDLCGYENTKRLLKCGILKNKLGEDEYLPSAGELKEAAACLSEINFVRRKLDLGDIHNCWLWSSTVQSRNVIWCLAISNKDKGKIEYWFDRGPYTLIFDILTFIRYENLV